MRFCIKKARAKSLVIYKAKSFGLLFQDWCPIRDDADVYTAASVWRSKWWRRQQDNLPPFLFAGYPPSGHTSLSESEVRAG
jgi:hypothetical protein